MPINLQPYKKRYTSVINSLIFATLTLLSAAFDRNVYASPSFAHLTAVKQSLLASNGQKDDGAQDKEQGNNEDDDGEAQLPDRVVYPELYEAQEINENSFLAVNIILSNLMCAFNINDMYM